jgi:hypothetical protein
MKFTLEGQPNRPWLLTLEGPADLVVDLLQGYTDGDHEAALDLFEDASPVGSFDRYRVSIPLHAATSEQDAAQALLDLFRNTPGFSHGTGEAL